MATIPEAALRARQKYIDGETVKAILADTEFSLDQLYYWLDGAPQSDGTTLLPPIPRRRIIVRKEGRAATRLALVERLMRATEMQVHAIEQRLASAGYKADDSDARATAVLARTMRELIALDEQKSPDSAPLKSAQADDDKFVPRDVDELRRELARRVDLLRQRRAAGGGVGDV